MITLIVPTRNRAHTLRRVLPSYFEQEGIDELIFVSDAGTDDTPDVVAEVARAYPGKSALVLRNDERLGASQSRNVGVRRARNDYILFCDDDEYLEAGYAATCLAKLKASGAAAVSGRRVYMHGRETPAEAVARFGTGLHNAAPFRPLVCEYVNGARYAGDIELPFTNAIILTTRALLARFPFDGHYARGNGYREETDYQMNLFVHDLRIIVTNDCHSIHLPLDEVRSGGQRTSSLRRLYWSIYYTRYFFGKYYGRYAPRMGLIAPRWVALLAFAIYALYKETLRPILYRGYLMMRTRTATADGRAR
jgi:glycosyltransferase involved in cell wall biosynthesis